MEENNVVENGSAWWGVLGCVLPLVGLILFLIWKEDKPKSAKAAGIGALIGFVLSMICVVLLVFSSMMLGYSMVAGI